MQESNEWRLEAAKEMDLKRLAQEELKKLKYAYQTLQREAQNCEVRAKYFENSTSKYIQGVSKIFPILEELKNEALLVSEQECSLESLETIDTYT